MLNAKVKYCATYLHIISRRFSWIKLEYALSSLAARLPSDRWCRSDYWRCDFPTKENKKDNIRKPGYSVGSERFNVPQWIWALPLWAERTVMFLCRLYKPSPSVSLVLSGSSTRGGGSFSPWSTSRTEPASFPLFTFTCAPKYIWPEIWFLILSRRWCRPEQPVTRVKVNMNPSRHILAAVQPKRSGGLVGEAVENVFGAPGVCVDH